MSERANKATICSVLSLDLPDQSSKPVFRQVGDKTLLKSITDKAVKDVSQDDLVLVDTGDGLAMAFHGAPEAALFIAMMIRDAIAMHNKASDDMLMVRIGIGIGPVLVGDVRGLQSIQGDGVNTAERLKNLAAPNQILVSRAYHDITSGLTEEIAGMFTPVAGEQEAYAVRPLEDAPFVPESAAELATAEPLMERLLHDEDSRRYGVWGGVALVTIVMLVGGFMLFSSMWHPDLGDVIADATPAPQPADLQAVSTSVPPVTSPPSPLTAPESYASAPELMEPADDEPGTSAEPQSLATQETVTRPRATQAAAVRSPSAQTLAITEEADSPMVEFEFDAASSEDTLPEAEILEPQEPPRQVAAAPAVRRGPSVEERRLPSGGRHKTVWDAFRESFKQGRKEHVCTQAEIALNQCK